MKRIFTVLFVLSSAVLFAITLRNPLPKEVQEFVKVSEVLNKSTFTGHTVTNTEHLDNGDRKVYFQLQFEKELKDGTYIGKDGIKIAWQGGQTIRFSERVVLTYDKDGAVVQRSCWSSDNKILSHTIFKK